jgi:uncharacterized protein YggE
MRKTAIIAIGGLVALAALFAACGGDSGPNGTSGPAPQANNIRVSKGLTVANISSQQQSSQNGNASAEGALAPGAAPAADVSGSYLPATGYGPGGGEAINAQQATNTTDNTGITVQGYGSATADADSAIVEFSFGNSSCCATPYPGIAPDVKPTVSAGTEITRESLQPVIDALIAAGVADSNIELLNQNYYDAYSSYGTLRATVNSIGSVDSAVEAAQSAAAGLNGIYLQNTNVSYTLSDCSALEKAAVQAAVEDAGDRAAVLADVLNVTLGPVAGASDYSYYQYGTGCGNDYYSPYPIAYSLWRAGGTGEGTVQVVSNISVTYSFQ